MQRGDRRLRDPKLRGPKEREAQRGEAQRMVPERGKCRGERLIEWSQREGSAEGRREAQRPKTKRSQREGSAEGRGSENGPREREVQRREAYRMVPERGKCRGERLREWSQREGSAEERGL